VFLLTGAAWLALQANTRHANSATWLTAGHLDALPRGATAIGLPEGRVLVAGGTATGTPAADIVSIDPSSGARTRVGHLTVARSGHIAALLDSGRVLFAGGTTADGPSSSVEIYDAGTGQSSFVGELAIARVEAAAATLADGRVLIVGGSNGTAALALAEIFDPATGQSVLVAAPMAAARTRATATTLPDGHVLVVGGNDGANDLATAEIFDPSSGSFFATGGLQAPRSGHVAVLLEKDEVLIASGQSNGEGVESAEVYADWRDGFVPAPNQAAAAQDGAGPALVSPVTSSPASRSVSEELERER